MAWVAEYLSTLEVKGSESISNAGRKQLGTIHSRIIFEKHVVIFGDTGQGKTNLVNHLFGKNIFDSYPSARSLTTQCQHFGMRVEYDDAEYVIHLHDTVGWNDTKKGDSVDKTFYMYLTDNVKLLNVVILVVQFGKMTDAWCKRFGMNLGRLNKWVSEHVIILVTNCPSSSAVLSFYQELARNERLKATLDKYKVTQEHFMFVDLNPEVTHYASTPLTQQLLLRIINSKEKHVSGIFPALQADAEKKKEWK